MTNHLLEEVFFRWWVLFRTHTYYFSCKAGTAGYCRSLGGIMVEVLAQKWHNWLMGLKQLSHYKVQRCFKPHGFGELASAQLHHFANACETGYGTVIYLLLEKREHQIHWTLLTVHPMISQQTLIWGPDIVSQRLTGQTCQIKHLLQMIPSSTELLCKYYVCRAGSGQCQRAHLWLFRVA